jgi:hypothetical protein
MFRVYVVDLTPERLKEVLYPHLHALCDGAQLASPASRSRRGLKINRCTAKASRPPFAFLVDVGGRFLTRGLRAVKAEAASSNLAFNILHAASIFETRAARRLPVNGRTDGMAGASRFGRGSRLLALYTPKQIDGRAIDNVIASSRASVHDRYSSLDRRV